LALEVIAQVRQAHPEIEFCEVDVLQHPERAVTHGVRATPAVVINGALVWEGALSAQALRECIEAHLPHEPC
jgi:protein-disulfide isomerase